MVKKTYGLLEFKKRIKSNQLVRIKNRITVKVTKDISDYDLFIHRIILPSTDNNFCFHSLFLNILIPLNSDLCIHIYDDEGQSLIESYISGNGNLMDREIKFFSYKKNFSMSLKLENQALGKMYYLNRFLINSESKDPSLNLGLGLNFNDQNKTNDLIESMGNDNKNIPIQNIKNIISEISSKIQKINQESNLNTKINLLESLEIEKNNNVNISKSNEIEKNNDVSSSLFDLLNYFQIIIKSLNLKEYLEFLTSTNIEISIKYLEKIKNDNRNKFIYLFKLLEIGFNKLTYDNEEKILIIEQCISNLLYYYSNNSQYFRDKSSLLKTSKIHHGDDQELIKSKIKNLKKNKSNLENKIRNYDLFAEWLLKIHRVKIELLGIIQVYHKVRDDLTKLKEENDLIAYQDEMINSIENSLQILKQIHLDLIKELNYVGKIKEVNTLIHPNDQANIIKIIIEITNTYYLRIGHDILLTEIKIKEYENIYDLLKNNLDGETEIFLKIKKLTEHCTDLINNIKSQKTWIKEENRELYKKTVNLFQLLGKYLENSIDLSLFELFYTFF